MKDEIKIRKAKESDLETFNKFSAQEAMLAYDNLPEFFYRKPNLNWTEKRFKKALDNKNSFFCVAESGGKVLGILLAMKRISKGYLRRNTKFAEIHTFWIDNLVEHKEEIAKQLLQEVEKWARQQNLAEIRSIEFIQANSGKKSYEQANFCTRNIGLFKDLC